MTSRRRTSSGKTSLRERSSHDNEGSEIERDRRGIQTREGPMPKILDTVDSPFPPSPFERKDGKRERQSASERMYTVKVLSPVHIVTVRANKRDGERKQKRERNKPSEDGASRDDVENFSRTFPDATTIPLGERNRRKKRARSKRVVADEASTIWEMKCRGIGKV